MIKHHFLSLFFINNKNQNKSKEIMMAKGIILFGGTKPDYNVLGDLGLDIKKYLSTIKVNHIEYKTEGKNVFVKDSDIVIYCEKKENRLQQAIDFCNENSLILINLTVDAINKVTIPKENKCVIINAPKHPFEIVIQLILKKNTNIPFGYYHILEIYDIKN